MNNIQEKMNIIQNISETPTQCNHHIKSEKTTIKLLSGRRTFTFPEYVNGVCTCCGKSFRYIRKEDGSLKSMRNKKEK